MPLRFSVSKRFGQSFALLCLLPLAALAQQGRAQNAALPYSEYERHSLYVPVRDGTRLAVNIYRPATAAGATDTPHPVVFAFTPYRARFRDADGSIIETGLSERLGLAGLTDHGYVVAVADIRGKGASFGARRGFQDRTEALDGHDIVEWLARQPWSDGNVGMVGCSYLGGTALHVATTAPPSLKAIFAGATDLDKYSFVRRGGITAQFNTRPDEPPAYDLQSLPVDTDTDGELMAAAIAEHAGNTPMAPLWYGMPYRDSESALVGSRFWEEVGPYTYLDVLRSSDIAMYFWSNWQDEPTGQMILAAANTDAKLLVGPGRHCNPPPGYDFAGEIRRFFDRHLKGIANGIDDEPRYTYWIDNAPAGRQWVRSDRLPGADSESTDWYFDVDRALSAERPASSTSRMTVDYDVSTDDPFLFWIAPLEGTGLGFSTGALESSVTMIGSPIVNLVLSVDQTDANVFAYIEDVAPDGTARTVSMGRLAASHRALSQAPPYDTLGAPWHSSNEADVEPLAPNVPVELRFALTPAAWVFERDHEIRVRVTGADPRQRNLQEIRRDPAPVITVYNGGDSASRIELPLVNRNDEP